MIPFRWNDYRSIYKARREKRRRAAEIARRKREIGARALIGATRKPEWGEGPGMFRGYEFGYGAAARGEKSAKWRLKIIRSKKAKESWPTFV